MYLQTLTLTAIITALSTPVHSWQSEIHNQIGFMADSLIHPLTRTMVREVLEPQYNGSLGLAAGWADEVRRTTHKYSYGWHFISAKDNPPNDCGLYYHRDCQEGGCVVQQIANQTWILERCLVDGLKGGGQTTLGIECSEALKWVTHFIGDVAQPLHTSERAFGGNTIKVMLNGTSTNLHQAWDQGIIYALAPLPSGASGKTLDPYFANLTDRILSDSFRSPRSTWDMCDLDARRGTYCAEHWAQDSNAIVCDYAYGRLVNGSDLLTGSDRYAYGAMHLIEEQIAKAAWRLSGWLDVLVERVLFGGEGEEESGEFITTRKRLSDEDDEMKDTSGNRLVIQRGKNRKARSRYEEILEDWEL